MILFKITLIWNITSCTLAAVERLGLAEPQRVLFH